MSAYDEGVEAYNRGETFGDNPYKKGTREYQEWNKGMSNKGDPGM